MLNGNESTLVKIRERNDGIKMPKKIMHEEFGIELSRSCPILGILFVSKV